MSGSTGSNGFNLSTVFDTVAKAVPDAEFVIWRDRRVRSAQVKEGGHRCSQHPLAAGPRAKRARPPPTEPSGDDLYILYPGGTTGMPKGVLWRNEDVYIAARGGRPAGSNVAYESYDDIAQAAVNGLGGMRMLMIPPLMHGAAQ